MAIARRPAENAFLSGDTDQERKLVLKGYRMFEDDVSRLGKLARRRRSKPAHLMREALRQFLDREEASDS